MASSASKRLLKELPSEDKMDEIMAELKALGPQATAIMGAAYLDHALGQLLRASFRTLDKENEGFLFDPPPRGILGSFSAKIRVAYATKLLHERVQKALLLVNDIRNVFAHSLHRVDFSHELVTEDCQRLAETSSRLSFAAGLKLSAVEGERLGAPNESIDIYVKIVGLLYRSIRTKFEDLTHT